ncbi:MAG: SDR family NAD(P)-dependent oxidoreductase, partial [Rhizobiales bacterium]|nr:SDR family NAD(P)-dependent oxidoreductase [Hyphomicrobiales bacterium]
MSAQSGRRRGVVTGAGSGIGKAVVRRLLREGGEVLAVDLRGEAIAEFAGPQCQVLAADVTDAEARKRIEDWADGADWLVNSAGIVDTPMQDAVREGVAPMRGISLGEWDTVRTKSVPLARAASPDECAGL